MRDPLASQVTGVLATGRLRNLLRDDADVGGERTGEVLGVNLRPRFERVSRAHPIPRIRSFGENVEGLSLYQGLVARRLLEGNGHQETVFLLFNATDPTPHDGSPAGLAPVSG
jgi:hypothetical protein